MDVYERMKTKGITLPAPPPPGGLYSPIREFADRLVYTSGVGSTLEDGSPAYKGKVGRDLTLEEGQAAARHTALNLVSLLHHKLGDLNRVKQIVKVLGFVSSADDFTAQPAVMNAASALFMDVFGEEEGRGARSAIAVNVLPGDIAVEIELVVELK